MNKEQAALYEDLTAVQFTCVDLNLYLNTHPWDETALACYNRNAERFMELRREYEDSFGPLCNFGYSASPSMWQWIDSPWPWEMEREV